MPSIVTASGEWLTSHVIINDIEAFKTKVREAFAAAHAAVPDLCSIHVMSEAFCVECFTPKEVDEEFADWTEVDQARLDCITEAEEADQLVHRIDLRVHQYTCYIRLFRKHDDAPAAVVWVSL